MPITLTGSGIVQASSERRNAARLTPFERIVAQVAWMLPQQHRCLADTLDGRPDLSGACVKRLPGGGSRERQARSGSSSCPEPLTR